MLYAIMQIFDSKTRVVIKMQFTRVVSEIKIHNNNNKFINKV